MNKNRKYYRIMETVLDVMYVIFCIGIIVLTVMVCMKPVDNAFCFPAIFLLASLLSFANAYTKLSRFSPNHGHSMKGTLALLSGLLLLVLAVVSALSVFR